MTAEKITATALGYVGQREMQGNMGFETPEFQAKMEKIGWEKGEPWCASFAKLVFSESYQDDQVLLAEIEKLFSKSAVQTYKNFDESNWKTQQPLGTPIMKPQVGALVVWKHGNGPAGHIGVVIEVINDTTFKTVEGNTDDQGGREGIKVAIKTRTVRKEFRNYDLNILGFVLPKTSKTKPKTESSTATQ